MTIIFFSMNSCGFCDKAGKLLEKHIHCGKIIKKPHTDANGKFSGFPAFLNTANGKTHTGLPSSAESLFEKLGYKDDTGYGADSPTPQAVTDYYVNHLKFTPTGVTSRILILKQGPDNFDTVNSVKSVGFIIEVLSKTPPAYRAAPTRIYVYGTTGGTTGTAADASDTTYTKIEPVDNVIFLKDTKMLQNLFPCVPKSIWAGNQDSIWGYLAKNPTLLMTPAPCKSNSKVFCCPNTDVDACPEEPFFDVKTIIMVSVIALLVIIIISYMMKMYKK